MKTKDTMFAAGDIPWGKATATCAEALNVNEALKLSGLDWKVKAVPFFYGAGNKLTLTKDEELQALVREDTGKRLGAATRKYKIIQNEDGFAFVDSLLNMGAKVSTAGSFEEGKLVWILAELPPYMLLDDEIGQYLYFANGFSGKRSLKCGVTDVRIICRNTFNLAIQSAARSWSVKHMGLDMKSKLMEATRVLELNNVYHEALKLEAESLAIKKISDADFNTFLGRLFPLDTEDSACVQQRIQSNKDAVTAACKKEDLANFNGTVWGVLQAVADVAFHKKPDRTTPTYDETLMGYAMDGHPLIDTAYTILKE